MQPRTRFRAVITGASRGIGRAIIREISPYCDHIIAISRHAGSNMAFQANDQTTKISVRTGDVADREFLADVVREAAGTGGVNLLINNAGVSDFSEMASQSPEDIATMVNINLLAPMQWSRSFLPLLSVQPAAQIINVGSALGYIGYPGYAAYCATKFGLRGFTEALARELDGTSVRARLFSPRATQTDINSEEVRQMNRELGVHADTPEEVARQFANFLFNASTEYRVGFPESLFTRINQFAPSIVTSNVRKQLPIIRTAMTRAKTL